MVTLTNRATGETVRLEKGSKRTTTTIVSFDPERGESSFELTKPECRKFMADLFNNKGWR